jgi:hypothetical protein
MIPLGLFLLQSVLTRQLHKKQIKRRLGVLENLYSLPAVGRRHLETYCTYVSPHIAELTLGGIECYP